MQPGGIHRATGTNVFDSNAERQRNDSREDAAELFSSGTLSDEAGSARKRDKSKSDSESKAEASVDEHARLAKEQLAAQSQQTAPPDTLMILEDAAEEMAQAMSSSRSSQNKSLEQRRTVGLSHSQDMELESEDALQNYMAETETDLTGMVPRLKNFLKAFEEDASEARRQLEEDSEGNATAMGMFLQTAIRFGEEGFSDSSGWEEEGEEHGFEKMSELKEAAQSFSLKDRETLNALKEFYGQWKHEHRVELYAGFNVASDAHSLAIEYLRSQGQNYTGSTEDRSHLRNVISNLQKDYGSLVLEAMQAGQKDSFQYHPSSVFLSAMAPEGGTKSSDMVDTLKIVRTKFKELPLTQALPKLVTMISHDISATKSSAHDVVLQTLFTHASTIATLANFSERVSEKMSEVQDVHTGFKVDADELTYDLAEACMSAFVMQNTFENIMDRHKAGLPTLSYNYDKPPLPDPKSIDMMKKDKQGVEVSMGFLRGIGDAIRDLPEVMIKRGENGREEILGITIMIQEKAGDTENMIYDLLQTTQEKLSSSNSLGHSLL